MFVETALIVFLITFVLILIITKAIGLSYKSSIALAALISIFILTLMKPLSATGMVKNDSYTMIYALIYLAVSIYLLWYILNCACNDWDECNEKKCCCECDSCTC